MLAVDTVRSFFDNPDRTWPGDPEAELAESGARLIEAATLANLRICEQAAALGREGMATTFATVLALRRHIWVAHAGDSRVYRLRDGQLVAVDLRLEEVRARDVVLLATDGLTKMVDEATIAEVLAQRRDVRAAACALIARALELSLANVRATTPPRPDLSRARRHLRPDQPRAPSCLGDRPAGAWVSGHAVDGRPGRGRGHPGRGGGGAVHGTSSVISVGSGVAGSGHSGCGAGANSRTVARRGDLLGERDDPARARPRAGNPPRTGGQPRRWGDYSAPLANCTKPSSFPRRTRLRSS
jgi:hypothetical protein